MNRRGSGAAIGRIDEGLPLVEHLAPGIHDDDRDLDDSVLGRVQSGRLHIDDSEVEVKLCRALCPRER